MKQVVKIFGIIIAIAALIILSNAYYIVDEDEVAVIKRFGRMSSVVVSSVDKEKVISNLEKNNYENVTVYDEKGLHFKVPFADTVEKYTAKYLTYISNNELINTNDERRIEIGMYAQYRVLDPIVFHDVVGNETSANQRMDEIVYQTVINAVNALEFNEFFYQDTLKNLLMEKRELLNEQFVSEYGIYITDISINYKSFPDSNVSTIEEKMAKEIEKDSEKLIAEGDSEYLQAKASTDRQKSEIISAAKEEAAVIKAAADAEAVKIYQDSLQKDLEFYQFIKRMEIYKNIEGTTIFLNQDNAIFSLIDGYDSIANPSQSQIDAYNVEQEALEASQQEEEVEGSNEMDVNPSAEDSESSTESAEDIDVDATTNTTSEN